MSKESHVGYQVIFIAKPVPFKRKGNNEIVVEGYAVLSHDVSQLPDLAQVGSKNIKSMRIVSATRQSEP